MPESPTLGSILKPSSSHPSSSSKSRASGQDTREKSVRYGSIRVHEDRYCYSQPVAMTTEGQSLAAEQLSPGIPSEDPEEEDGDPCSWGLLQPRWCQMFRNPKAVLFCFCWAGAIQGMIVNGFVSVVITTIEKRFDLASTETGIIASFFDISAVLCLIPVSYLGGFGRKPRWVATGVFLVGLGSLLFGLPHFMTGLYHYDSTTDSNQCLLKTGKEANSTLPMCSPEQHTSTLNRFKYIFILAQMLHGAGATPLCTLGITYMDENLKAKMTPVYTGIFYAMSIIGPAVGYMIGGEFLKRFTDLDRIDVTTVLINVDSPHWVGAWWIGFFFVGLLAILMAIPIAGFPKMLPGSMKLRAERASEVYCGSEDTVAAQPGVGTSFRDIPLAIKVLVTNPTFMCLNMAGASEGLLVSGFTAFTPKFIESQFSISAGLAAQFVGFATIPTGGGGTFLGGFLVKKLELNCPGILKMCLCTSFMSLLLIMVFLIRCPNVNFAGVNQDYSGNRSLGSYNLPDSCNSPCSCDRDRYDPICGSNNVMYFSPCYAGCRSVREISGKKVYYNCSCIEGGQLQTDKGVLHGAAQEGKCGSDCHLLAIFLPIFALSIFTTFCTSMPALSATLRCVPTQQRSFALGIQWILVRCLGSIPAPIFFGSLIDHTCQLWQGDCQHHPGSCLFYDNATMGRYILALALLGKGLAFIFFFLALMLYRPPPKPASLPVITTQQAGSIQMMPRDKTSVDSKLSGVTMTTNLSSRRGSAGSRAQGGQPSPKVQGHSQGQGVTFKTTTSASGLSTTQAKYQPVPQ